MPEEPFPLGAIPERLKCAICTALARDAWKLPCCDQIVCGSCFDTLPTEACPICAFSPVDKEKGVPSTSLRTTIAVFLRHAEKRHKDALAKEAREDVARSGSSVQNVALQSTVLASRPVEPAMPGDEGGMNVKDHSEVTLAQDPAHMQSLENGTSRQETSSLNNSAMQQQQREYEKMYGGGTFPSNGVGMDFNSMMTGFPMGMNPMMMQQMVMTGGFGGYGGNGMNWSPNMMQSYPQNMNMQAQESTFPDHAPPAGPSMPDYSNRGGFRGRYTPRGHVSSFRGARGGYQPSQTPLAPVFVEGAPTGPSAMRNGVDSRGRAMRGRSGTHRGVAPRPVHGHEDVKRQDELNDGSNPASEQLPDSVRGRSMTRSVTRERSFSPRRKRSPAARDRSRERGPSQTSGRSRSTPEKERTRNSRKSHHDRSTSREPARRRDRPLIPEEDEIMESVPKSLADRIEKIPGSRSRSSSPRPDKHRSRRSSHRSRRRRSTSRDRKNKPRSRSDERRQRSRRDQSSERDSSRKHKRHHNVFEEPEPSDKKSSRRRKSRDRDSHRRSSRRSNPKFEIGSPELRRLEDQRENARYD